jgi:hypothetical protein
MSDVNRICRVYVWRVRPSRQSKRQRMLLNLATAHNHHGNRTCCNWQLYTCCNWQLYTILNATAHAAIGNCTQSSWQPHILHGATAHNPYGNRTCCNGQLHNVSPQGPPQPFAVASASSSHHSLQGVLPCSEKNSCNLIQPMLTRQHHEAP